MDEIKIREATKSDSPDIVELLKVSLGESTEKSIDNWYWKHYENPFGESKIYVATINSEIVGVRAFMQWKWIEKTSGEELRALRAVDTAVSPHHRRKGIFLSLTQHALEKVAEEKFDFIFNTPNEKSIGGYLKLGWVLNRKIPVALIINPFFWLNSKKKMNAYSETALNDVLRNDFVFSTPFMDSDITCPFSKEYFSWRYVKNPLANYKFFNLDNEVLVVYRLKSTKGVTECRVVDIQLLAPNSNKQIKKAISILVKRYFVVSLLKGVSPKLYPHATSFTSVKIEREGPNMVTKKLNFSEKSYNKMLDANSSYWGFNLGEMELF